MNSESLTPNSFSDRLKAALDHVYLINQEHIQSISIEYGATVITFNDDSPNKENVKLEGVSQKLFNDLRSQNNYEGLIQGFMEDHNVEFFEAKGLLDHYLARLRKLDLIHGP